MGRIEVCKVSELPDGEMRGAGDGDSRVLVANVGGAYYAMRAVCNHEGGPLDEGPMFDGEITCPWHGSVWDVRTGRCSWFSETLRDEPVYKIVIENDIIFVET